MIRLSGVGVLTRRVDLAKKNDNDKDKDKDKDNDKDKYI